MRQGHRRFARRDELDLTQREFAALRRLSTPQKVQIFLDAVPINHEIGGETVLSVREVLRQKRAHCIEGALLAACALWVHGERPLVMHLDCATSDYPHLVALFRRSGCWGAISKTNHLPLRYRDPVYRTLRELAMSYFHEYCNRRGQQTLRSYSRPFDLRRVDPKVWVTNEQSCWEMHDRLAATWHYPLISLRQEHRLSRRDSFEREQSLVAQYPPSKTRNEGTPGEHEVKNSCYSLSALPANQKGQR